MPIPLIYTPTEHTWQSTRIVWRQAAVRGLRTVGSAIGHQATLMVLGSAVWVSQRLWLPLAFMVAASGVVAVAFWVNGSAMDAVEATVFGVAFLGLMAGARWVERLYTRYRVRDLTN